MSALTFFRLDLAGMSDFAALAQGTTDGVHGEGFTISI